jgi:hypothetical protein
MAAKEAEGDPMKKRFVSFCVPVTGLIVVAGFSELAESHLQSTQYPAPRFPSYVSVRPGKGEAVFLLVRCSLVLFLSGGPVAATAVGAGSRDGQRTVSAVAYV